VYVYNNIQTGFWIGPLFFVITVMATSHISY